MDAPTTPASTFALDTSERRRVLALALRLREARFWAIGFLAPAVVLGAVTYGPGIVPFVLGLLAGFGALGVVLQRPRRPELPLTVALVWAQLMLSGMLAVADVYQLDALGLLILPASAACLLFPRRLAAPFLLWSVALMVGVAFGIEPSRVLDDPPVLILPIGVLLCVSLPAMMVRRLEVESRATALTDPLTGALNRTALELRLSELAEQEYVMPLRVGVLMADLDHFKSINDELGHARGDEVLRETVRRMRTELGPMTPVYRAGGEEFAVLIAGADDKAMASVAEQLRRAVAAASIDGRAVTVSIGVAAATLDRHPVKALLEFADAALYDAKRAGRDRVVTAPVPDGPSNPTPSKIRPLSTVGPVDDILATDAFDTSSRAPRLLDEAEVTRQPLAATAVSFGHDQRNWLVRGDFEREHIRASARAMARTHHGALGMIGLALVASIPWIGWLLMLPAILPVVAYHVVERRIRTIRRPEYALGAAWLAVQIAIFFGAVIDQHGHPYLLILFVPLMISVTAVFPSRGVIAASVSTFGLMLVGFWLSRPDLFPSMIGLFVPPSLIIAGFALMSSVAGRSAIEFSTRAVVDPLTGLLTRAALQSRLEEIGPQALVAAPAVSVITFDVDAFKPLNDTYGHAVGDAVLRAVGEATRSQLGALEWGFRLGGDEFLVVVPTDEAAATTLANTLRAALAAIDINGVGISGSFGVAGTRAGEAFDFDALSCRADEALYEAKSAGRNRVCVAPRARPAAATTSAPDVARAVA